MKPHRSLRIPNLLALLSLPAIPHLHAADGTWDADADGNWSDIANWSSGAGPVADGADFTATFDNVITANRTVTLDTARTIGNITAADTSHNFTISGGNTLTLDLTAGTPTINVATSDSRQLTIGSVIAGTDGLAKTGGGRLSMTGINTFTGGIDHSGGRIVIFDNANEQSSLGDSSNILTFTGDAQLYNANNTVDIPQGITINGGVTGSVTGAFGEKTYVAGPLAGSGTLIVQGFSAGFNAEFRNTANTFTGPIQILSGDSSRAGFASLPDSPGATTIGLQSNGNLGGAFDYLGSAIAPIVYNNRQFELIGNGGSGTNLGRQAYIRNNAPGANTMTINTDLLITGTGTKKLFLDGGNSGDNTFAGVIPDGVSGDDFTLYKNGGGKWILTGANTYEGDTIIQNGSLEIGGAGQLGAGGTYPGNITNTDASPNDFVFNSSANSTLSGTISGGMGLNKDGSGTLALTGSTTYSGTTTVTAGTLSLGDGATSTDLNDLGTLSVETGAVADLNFTGSDTVLLLNLGGSPAAAGTWGATGSGATNINDTFFTGTGVINNLAGGTGSLGLAFWDGGTTDIGSDGNASSAGGGGTWDTTILNWDQGFAPHVAWPDDTSTTAVFGGTNGGTVALGADMSIENLNIELPNGNGTPYTIGEAAEDNTLTFGGNATITATATGSGSRHDHVFQAGITGAPTVNLTGRNNNNANHFRFQPPAGVTMTLGSVNMFNTLGSNKTLVFAGASSGNVADAVTWSLTNNQMFLTKAGTGDWTITNNLNIDDGRLYVEQGTLTILGTDNFFSHRMGVSQTRRSNDTATNLESKLIIGGDLTINDNREWLRVKNLGTLSPGPGITTLNLDWIRNNGDDAKLQFQNGSTLEWEVGAANATDVIDIAEIGSQDNYLELLPTTTLMVVDSGGSPVPADQLTVFTYDLGVTTPDTATLNANVTIDLSGTTWTGTPSFVNDGAGTIYVTGIDSGGAANPFDTWAGTGTLGPVTFEGDTNGDGVQDGIAFLLGVANPDDDANGALPDVSEDGSGGLVLTFDCLPSGDRGTAELRIEHSSDLGGGDPWQATTDQVPDATDAVPDNGVTFVVTPGSPTNAVVATIGSSEAAGGKLFGRLTATE